MTAPAAITLEYGRKGELSTGRILVGPIEVSFESCTFEKMLYLLAIQIQARGPCVVDLVRTDPPSLVPYRLDAVTVELLRKDPVAAVKTFVYLASPDRRFECAPTQPSGRTVLRTGFDLLADAFGEIVYAAHVRGEVECPGCGFWSPLTGPDFVCKKLCNLIWPMTLSEHWAGVRVWHLLASRLERFYLPRAWNPDSWIARSHLEQRYMEYLKEKGDVACSIRPDDKLE